MCWAHCLQDLLQNSILCVSSASTYIVLQWLLDLPVIQMNQFCYHLDILIVIWLFSRYIYCTNYKFMQLCVEFLIVSFSVVQFSVISWSVMVFLCVCVCLTVMACFIISWPWDSKSSFKTSFTKLTFVHVMCKVSFIQDLIKGAHQRD